MPNAETIRRIEAVKPLILGGMPIWKAAMEVGWAGPNLHNAFKKAEGMTPGEWVRSLPSRQTQRVYRRTKEQSGNYDLIRHGRNARDSARWLCRGCGEDFGNERPQRCQKCGSHSFETARA